MEARHSGRWIKGYIGIIVIVVWELLSYFKLIDPTLLSHPLGIVKTIFDWDFLRSFGYIFLVPILTIVPGIAIGLGFGFLILSNERLNRTIIQFLRLIVWIPFLVLWTLPFWPTQAPYFYQDILWIAGTSIVAIALVSCREHIISQSILKLKWHESRHLVMHAAILQAIFISLFSQFWLPNWYWRLTLSFGSVSILFGILLLLILVFLLTEKFLGTSFEQVSMFRRTVLIEETQAPTLTLLFSSMTPVVVCLLFWQFLGAIALYDISVSPLEVLKRAFYLLTHPTIVQGQSLTIWGHMALSLIEIAGGILLSMVLVFLTIGIMSSNEQLRNILLRLLLLTHPTSLVLPLVLIYWQIFVLPSLALPLISLTTLKTVIVVASVSFFPLIQLMWSPSEKQPIIYHVSTAIMDALPFAFVGMIFGEAFGAVSGLGFFVVAAAGGSQTIDRISGCFLVVMLLSSISFIFQWLVKRMSGLRTSD